MKCAVCGCDARMRCLKCREGRCSRCGKGALRIVTLLLLAALVLTGCTVRVTMPTYFCTPAEYDGLRGAACIPIEGAKK